MSSHYTYPHRAIIENALSYFFGTQVKPSERVCQILEAGSHFGGDSQTYILLVSILRCVPAIAALLEQLGADISYLLRPSKQDSSHIPLNQYVIAALGQAFLGDYFDPNSLNIVASDVRRSKELAVGHLIRAPLCSPYNWPDNIPQTMLSSLLCGMGIDPMALTRSEIEHKAQSIASRLGDLKRIDPSADSQQFLLSWDGKGHSIKPFGAWGAFQLEENRLPDGSLWVARGNVIEGARLFTDEALSELEGLIDSGANEASFQRFFDRHREFLVALGDYANVHPQLILHEDAGDRLIPDFFLEKLNSDFCDICDLKRPTSDLIRNQKNRLRFRDAVMEGVAQLRVYRDWFEDRTHRSQFRARYGLDAYRPEVVLIIGRRQSFYDEVERIRLESDLPNWVRLATYDDVVGRARQWKRLIRADALAQERESISR